MAIRVAGVMALAIGVAEVMALAIEVAGVVALAMEVLVVRGGRQTTKVWLKIDFFTLTTYF